MNIREWALVAFTLLMQASVGVLLIVSASHAFVSRGPVQPPARAFELPLLVATGAGVLALLASLAHLGQPLQAWLAVGNLRTSWLSREIMLALLFTADVAVVAALFRLGMASPAVRYTACAVAVALGVAAVYAMSRLYMLPAQPAWDRITTPVGFFATTLLLGALVVIVTRQTSVRPIVLLAVALAVVQVLLVPAQVGALAHEPAAAISAASVGSLATWLAVARAALALAAAVLLASMLRAVPAAPLTPVTALVLVFLSEILGRVFFYASRVRI